MQAKSVTTKNSGARNLHRLRTAILFIQQLFQRLVADREATLAAAASAAYAETLSPYHSTVIRGTVTTGFVLLPSRATFLAQIQETGAQPVCALARLFCRRDAASYRLYHM